MPPTDHARLTRYADFAHAWAQRPDLQHDPSFSIRVLRQSVLQATTLDHDQDLLDWFHAEPPHTGTQGWDALLAGVAVFTGAGRTSPGTLDWCRDHSRWCTELFDPLNIPDKYLLLEMLQTPAAIRERNVILSIGNLQGA